MNSCVSSALRLAAAGVSVIPLAPASKIPFTKWERYKTEIASEAEIRGWFEAEPNINIGLVCGKVSGVVAVDVDGEEGAAWFKDNMPEPLLVQYSRADNPNRFHALYAHPMNCLVPPSVKALHPQIDIRGDGSYIVFAPSIHPDTRQPYRLAPQTGYTGMKSLSPLPYTEILQKGLRSDSGAITDDTAFDFGSADSDDTLYDFRNGAVKGQRNDRLTSLCGRWFRLGMTFPEVEAIAMVYAGNFVPPLNEREVQTVIKSVQRYHNGGESQDEVRAWVEKAKGEFTLSDLYRELHCTSPDRKRFVRDVLSELHQAGMIENNGARYGSYRKADRSRQYIDLDAEEEARFDVKLPLGLSDGCIVQEKNIIIVAGESNAGKTAWLFELCRLNLGKRRINYITSEMTATEINSRIALITGGERGQWADENCIRFQYRPNDYHEVLDADDINIVDFLEVHENFSEVGKRISQCFNALGKGICVIALQKKRGEDFARGGEFTIEKARLAVSLFAHGHTDDSVLGSCKVMKCKNYVQGSNPDGKEMFYNLKLGHEYAPLDLAGVAQGFYRYTDKKREGVIKSIEAYCEYVQDNPIQPQEEKENPLW